MQVLVTKTFSEPLILLDQWPRSALDIESPPFVNFMIILLLKIEIEKMKTKVLHLIKC